MVDENELVNHVAEEMSGCLGMVAPASAKVLACPKDQGLVGQEESDGLRTWVAFAANEADPKAMRHSAHVSLGCRAVEAKESQMAKAKVS